jgi:hypothetical protein
MKDAHDETTPVAPSVTQKVEDDNTVDVQAREKTDA